MFEHYFFYLACGVVWATYLITFTKIRWKYLWSFNIHMNSEAASFSFQFIPPFYFNLTFFFHLLTVVWIVFGPAKSIGSCLENSHF